MDYKSAVFVTAFLLAFTAYESHGFLPGLGGGLPGGAGNMTSLNISCYTCDVTVNGTCPETPTNAEIKNCSIGQTFCERNHDSTGAVTKRGCIEICISITDFIPIPELRGIVEMVMGGGNGCCQTDLCNGAGQRVYNVFVLVVCLFAGSRLVQ